MIILLRGRHGIELSWRGLVPDPPYIKRAFFLGFPGSVELSTRGLGLMVMSFLVASFGTLTIAAYGVGSTILQVVMIPAMGLSMAVSTLVGQNIGAGNIQRASRIALLGAALGFGILTLVGIVAFVVRAPHRGVLRAATTPTSSPRARASSASCAWPGAASAFSFASCRPSAPRATC